MVPNGQMLARLTNGPITDSSTPAAGVPQQSVLQAASPKKPEVNSVHETEVRIDPTSVNDKPAAAGAGHALSAELPGKSR